MRTLAKVLILVAFGTALTGCVVAPYPARRVYVAPAVVVQPAYPRYYYGPRYYAPRW